MTNASIESIVSRRTTKYYDPAVTSMVGLTAACRG